MRLLLMNILLASVFALKAQQLPQFRQFILAPSVYNPAAMAFNKQTSVSMSGRWQMSGFGYEPRTLVFYGQTLLKKKKKELFNPGSRIQHDFTPTQRKKIFVPQHFVGGQVISDNYGAFSFLDIHANYAMNLPLGKRWKASLGGRLGLRNNVFRPTQGVVLNPMDVQLPYAGGDATYDEFIGGNQRSLSLSGALGIGITDKKLIFSASMHHGGIPNTAKNQLFWFDQRLHWNAMLGYNIKVMPGFDILPAVMVKKMDPAPLSLEFSALATINYIFWGGFNYHYGASAGVMAGMEVSGNLKIGYALDFSTNRLNRFVNGGHEIYLSYGF